MYAERASAMLRELRNSKWLPPYDESGVRHAAGEMSELISAIMDTVAKNRDALDQREMQCGILLHHRSVQRNKRVVLAYLMNRLRRIQTLRWESGGMPNEDTLENLSRLEREFLAKYNTLLARYNAAVKMDITTEQQPPSDLLIEVRVLKDCGNIVTEDGPVNLTAGTAHYLRRADVEHLIRQGNLEHRL